MFSAEETLKEIQERVRRIETRLTRLARHVGVDRDEAPAVTVEKHMIHVQVLDVPISTVLRVARANGLSGKHPVLFRGATVCELEVTNV